MGIVKRYVLSTDDQVALGRVTLGKLEALLLGATELPWDSSVLGTSYARDADVALGVAAVNALPALVRLARAVEALHAQVHAGAPCEQRGALCAALAELGGAT